MTWTVVLVGTAGIAVFDWQMPLGVAAAVPYIGVIFVTYWLHSRPAAFLIALATTILTVVNVSLSPGAFDWIVGLNRALAIGGIWIAFTFVLLLQRSDEITRHSMKMVADASRAKSNFLATMSHELRTPLNAILGFSEILEKQYFGPPGAGKYREYAGDIRASAQHLLDLVDELLDISAIEAGRKSLHKEPLTIRSVATECVHLIKGQADPKGIVLEIAVPGDLPPLCADRRALKQIFLNLLINAVKYTPHGGRIDVTAATAGAMTRIVVSDTGPGIPPESLSRIFASPPNTGNDAYTTAPGWGLGLAISKSLVDLHGGDVEIESELGKGTSVRIQLPTETR